MENGDGQYQQSLLFIRKKEFKKISNFIIDGRGIYNENEINPKKKNRERITLIYRLIS